MAQLHPVWTSTTPVLKKLLARSIAYNLQRNIDRAIYDVVHNGFIDVMDIHSDEPDIVVYDKAKNAHTLQIIELSSASKLDETLRTVEIISQLYHIRESFVYDFDRDLWFKFINGNKSDASPSYSTLLNLDFNRTVSY